MGGSPRGPESAAFTCAFLPPVQCPCHAGLLLSCKPSWRHSATQGAGPGSGLFPLGAGTAALSRSRSESGSSWGRSVAPLAYPWLTLVAHCLAEQGGCVKSCQSHPSAQLCSSEVPAPGPVEFPRSIQKIPREGRTVADHDRLPHMQVLTSYFQHLAFLALVFSLPLERRGELHAASWV